MTKNSESDNPQAVRSIAAAFKELCFGLENRFTQANPGLDLAARTRVGSRRGPSCTGLEAADSSRADAQSFDGGLPSRRFRSMLR